MSDIAQPPADQQQQTPPAAPSHSADDIRVAVREAFQEYNAPDDSQQPPMSDDERDRLMSVWKPDDNYVNKLRRAITAEEATPQERLEALIELRSGLSSQSQRYADVRAEALKREIMAVIQPLLGHYQSSVQESTKNTFYSEYGELKDYPEVVQATALELKRRGVNPKTPQEARKLLAEETAKVLGRINPAFKLNPRQETQPSQQSGGMPPMANLSGGATGGGGRKVSTNGSGIWDD